MRPESEKAEKLKEIDRIETHIEAYDQKNSCHLDTGHIMMNHYEVKDLLGSGGVADVYLVEHLSFDQDVFAVKILCKNALISTASSLAYLREIRIWMDLPKHPNLTSCYFIRSAQDYIAIFAEYVDGGTLSEWIRAHKILTAEKILDISIQLVWGLQAAYDAGVIHQDVKPSNVLMIQAGIAKITDFGLATTDRIDRRVESVSDVQKEALGMTGIGLTPAYCSPEQANGERITWQTDIWSWGITVMEMLMGKSSCQYGMLAPAALDILSETISYKPFKQLAAQLTPILSRCFKLNPQDRWECLSDLESAILEIYTAETGHPYPRIKPVTKPQTKAGNTGQAGAEGMSILERDSLQCLKLAYKKLMGNKMSEPLEQRMIHDGSVKSNLLMDLERYEKAQHIYSWLVRDDTHDVEDDLALILYKKARVHEQLGNLSGAVTLYNNAQEILERLVLFNDRRDLSGDLAAVYLAKGRVLLRSGEYHAAIDQLDKSLSIRDTHLSAGEEENSGVMPDAYLEKSKALAFAGNLTEASGISDHAIELLTHKTENGSQRNTSIGLARAYSTKADILRYLGAYSDSIPIYDAAISIQEKLVFPTVEGQVNTEIGIAYYKKAISLNHLGKNMKSIKLFDRAIKILENKVYMEQWFEGITHLAAAYMEKSVALRTLGFNENAVNLCDKAIRILETEVYSEGRDYLDACLAEGYMNKAIAMRCVGNRRDAVEYFSKAKIRLEGKVYREHQQAMLGDLLKLRLLQADMILPTEITAFSTSEIRMSFNELALESDRTKRADLQSVLHWAKDRFESILKH